MFTQSLVRFDKAVITVAAIAAFANTSVAQSQVVRIQIVADEMCCQGCAQKVAAQLYAAPGVTSVEADVPKRLITVTAKPSRNLTYERLWAAVEKGRGAPSKLVAQDVTYVLTKPGELEPQRRMAASHYLLVVRSLANEEDGQQVANRLYAINGVKNVSLDLANHTLVIVSAPDTVLSPWAIAGAAEAAEHDPTSVNGPYGLMAIERSARTASGDSGYSVYSQSQGGVR